MWHIYLWHLYLWQILATNRNFSIRKWFHKSKVTRTTISRPTKVVSDNEQKTHFLEFIVTNRIYLWHQNRLIGKKIVTSISQKLLDLVQKSYLWQRTVLMMTVTKFKNFIETGGKYFPPPPVENFRSDFHDLSYFFKFVIIREKTIPHVFSRQTHILTHQVGTPSSGFWPSLPTSHYTKSRVGYLGL